ncbi:serpin A3-5-like [Xyrichtys novacula]|uniref:Thyroxine-binding globulin n=1 Tax=Xyrichtys novacula TaxID=13765 RepID=A0AAV1G1Z1_XYRNO|nr:serpin A3-5-like [Xyrichtys novacula]
MMHAALTLWILSAVICVGRGHHHIGHGEEGDQAEEGGAERGPAIVLRENNHFAFRLYKKLSEHADSRGKNIFYSPSSVSQALAALSVGARGETHKQLFSGLGYNNSLLTQTDVDQAFQTLMERMNMNKEVSEGTAVFADNRFEARPEFLETLRQFYSADGFNVDFTKTKESADTINKYVAGKTHGKIDKLVEDMDPSTVMYLISYIYYKGQWANPFNTALTAEADFNVDENTKVKVQMMNMEEMLDTYHDQAINTSVLHLPFNDSFSMLLLLPDNMETLENSICPAHVTKWLKWMRPSMHDVYVPKFSIKSSYKLNDMLISMGMSDMFGDRADLSGISEGQKLAVSEVVHQATLDVDEAGATAAAATGIGITLMSMRFVPVLKFNRPFMVVITERQTQNILFMGKIVNPTI